eukprot:SAG11_NODE_1788_length_4257_cov_2.181097_4_plen_136_part_00
MQTIAKNSQAMDALEEAEDVNHQQIQEMDDNNQLALSVLARRDDYMDEVTIAVQRSGVIAHGRRLPLARQLPIILASWICFRNRARDVLAATVTNTNQNDACKDDRTHSQVYGLLVERGVLAPPARPQGKIEALY